MGLVVLYLEMYKWVGQGTSKKIYYKFECGSCVIFNLVGLEVITMVNKERIYIPLPNEGTQVWIPTMGEKRCWLP